MSNLRPELCIGQKERGGRWPIELRGPQGSVSDRLVLKLGPLRHGLAPETAAAALRDEIVEQSPRVSAALKAALEQSAEIGITITSPSLFGLPWEEALRRIAHGRPVACMRRVEGSPRTGAVTAPLDLFWAEAGVAADLRLTDVPKALKYYRATVAQEVSARQFAALGTSRSYDIVHLRGLEGLFQGGRGLLHLPGASETLSVPQMVKMLRSAAPRLLVLEGAGGSFQPLLDFAHRVSASTGVVILVIEPPSSGVARKMAARTYLDLVHDEPLDVIVERLRQHSPRVALIGPLGSEDVLRLSRSLGAVQGRRLLTLGDATCALTHLETAREQALSLGGDETLIGRFDLHIGELRRKQQALSEARDVFDFSFESEGSRPMELTERRTEVVREAVERARPLISRVVNTRFLEGSRWLAPRENLRPGGSYLFEIQIGLPSETSNNRSEGKALPESQLERVMSMEGLELRAILFSADFEITESERPLWLPPQPKETQPVRFQVTAPAASGVAEAQLGIYWKNNLIQALRVRAFVGEGSRRAETGNSTEVIWTFDGELDGLESLPGRDVNLFVAENGRATHTLSIVGEGLRMHARLDVQKLITALSTCRERLLKTAQNLYDKGAADADNQVSPERLESELGKLAFRGRDLYLVLVPPKQNGRLNNLLRAPTTVQITNADSLEHIFPWAVVYDRPLVGEPRLCPDFAAVMRRGPRALRRLEALPCFTTICAHAQDSSVVCPSGFWGYRHRLEQPLSLTGETNAKPCLTLPGSSVALMLVANESLKKFRFHEKKLRELIGDDAVRGPMYSHRELQAGLSHNDLQVVYFYCHGVRGPDFDGTVIEFGRKGEQPQYLRSSELADLRIVWQSLHPLVFFNGCHTVDTGPRDLGSFNSRLRECGAGGVIGTEIEVHERLAGPFGERFLKEFLLEHAKLGEAMRRLRLWLLLKGNPLGLAYTHYGHNDLQIEEA